MSIPFVKLVWNAAAERFDEPSDTKSLDRFLQLGQVPEAWWARASKLPGKALAVGMSIWSLALAVKKATVMVTPEITKALDIDAATKSRALTALAQAGLIALERRRGRFPTATLTFDDGVVPVRPPLVGPLKSQGASR